MSERYSFVDIYRKELELNKDIKAQISQIVIPKIQRPYAQGRQDGVCTYVRNTLLNEMFANFKTDNIFDFNFIYGIIRPANDEYVMELLDGQQRMTTLFLVHWYIANRELKEGDEEDKVIRDALSRFVYETRSTATVFCGKMASYRVDLSTKYPSQAIRQAKWYFKSFDRDSTISAMLTMLDAIHERYIAQDRDDLHTRLHNLQFYVKSLGYFNLSEELYIKMNARGLQLSPFENFKADLTNFISNAPYEPYKELFPLYKKNSDEKVEFHFNFSVKLDAKWIDMFWKQGSENFDAAYMNFFTRFFACKYIIATKDEITDRDIRSDKTLRQFYTDVENSNGINEYFGFQEYEQLLLQHPEYVLTLNKVLDIFHEYDFMEDKKVIFRQLLPSWEKSSPADGDDFYSNASTKMTHTKLIVFGAVIEFIEAYKEFDVDTFHDWMRVVWNVVENTNIDSLTPVSSLIRKFSAVIKNTARISVEKGAFYSALAQWKDSTERENRALLEEVRKAQLISTDKQWKSIFVQAEQHPFFKGMVLFFYDQSMTIEDYTAAYNLVKNMFDANGITPFYRSQHVLIRAIVSHFSSWDDIRELYVTERSETNKYLKNILASSAPIRRMFADVSSAAHTGEEAIRLLKDVIDNAAPFVPWEDATEIEEEYCKMAAERIRHDVLLYDWIADEEALRKNVYRIYWYEGHIMFAVPRKQFAKVALDTERAKIAFNIANNFGFQYYDVDQLNMYKKYGDSFGNEIWLWRDMPQCKLWIGLRQNHALQIRIECQQEQYATELMKKIGGCTLTGEDEWLVDLPTLTHFQADETYRVLSNKIEQLYKIVA